MHMGLLLGFSAQRERGLCRGCIDLRGLDCGFVGRVKGRADIGSERVYWYILYEHGSESEAAPD